MGAITIWLTGLPCSGKSSIAKELAVLIRKRGKKVEILDGDKFRQTFSSELGFSKRDREKNLMRAISLAKILNEHGVTVIASFVSPYRSTRLLARKQLKNFLEIYIKCPLAICISRDSKGMYKMAAEGLIQNFTGVNNPYEEPRNPNFIVDTSEGSASENTGKFFEKLLERKVF